MRKEAFACIICGLGGLLLLMASIVSASPAESKDRNGEYGGRQSFCLQKNYQCTDAQYPLENGKYVGHDEPSVLFYSDTRGAGNSAVFTVVLPGDPPTLPKQNGKGGTFNFQIHPAFWFGVAMCDTQSAPEFTNICTPDSDSNIFDGADPSAPDYIGYQRGLRSWRCSSIRPDGCRGQLEPHAMLRTGVLR